MLLAGIGTAAAIVVAVAGLFVLSRRGEVRDPLPASSTPRSPDSAGGVTAGAPGAAAGSSASASPRVELWKRADAAESAPEYLELARWCGEKGLDADRKRSLERALAYDPRNKEARTALGHVLYEPPDDLLFSPGHDRELDPFADRWLDAEEQAFIAKLEAIIRARNQEIEEAIARDPWMQRALAEVRACRSDAALKAFTLQWAILKPYVVYVETDDAVQGKALATSIAENLCDLHAHFIRTFQGMLHHTDREPVFQFVLFAYRKGFDDYNEKHSSVRGKKVQPPGPEVLAYYNNPTGRVISYRQGRSDRDVLTGQNYTTTFHEGVHQLRAFYTLGGKDGYEAWTFWWNEGIAEYLAPAWDPEAAGARRHRFSSVHRGRVNELKRKIQEGEFVPLWDLLSRTDLSSVERYLSDTYKLQPNERERRLAELVSLFYAQSWCFIHFLDNHRNGKYRDAFARYCELELRGMRDKNGKPLGSRVVLNELLGIENRADCDALETEWIAYVESL